MSTKTTTQKLFIKENSTNLILNAPEGYENLLGVLPKGAKLIQKTLHPVDLIQVFLSSKSDLIKFLKAHRSSMTSSTTIWITYPKGSSKISSDINRDSIREYVESHGLKTVAIFSLDETWSALRLKVIQQSS